MSKRTSQLPTAAAVDGDELLELSQLSSSVTITASTLSAQASDNSFNDSANGFVAAGFTAGKAVKVTGFTGNVANNIFSAVVTAVTAGKLTIGGTDGDVIVDDAAGESVTITQWDSVRATSQDIADLAGAASYTADETSLHLTGSTFSVKDGGVTNAKLANVSTATFKGRRTAGTGAPEDLTAAQAMGVMLGWFNVKAYGALGDGATDDTTAIQSAIDAAVASNNGGVIYFPPGVYIVGGALQDTSYSNCQLRLPARSFTSAEQLSIEFRGAYSPPNSIAVVGGGTTPVSHSIIKGTLNAGAGGALLGGQGSSGGFTNILARMFDLAIRMPSNPVLSAVNFAGMAGCELDNVVIDVGTYSVPSVTQPTTATSYGLKLPANNNGAMTRLGTVMACGFYTGFQIGEHTVGHNVSAWACARAVETLAGNHASHFDRLMAVSCPRGIVASGGTHYLTVAQFDTEHAASGWAVPVYDLDDTNNYLTGKLQWHDVLGGSGPDSVFNRNGGSNMRCKKINGSRATLTYAGTITVNLDVADVVDVTMTGNPTINFAGGADGDKVMLRLKQDGTGSRTVTWGTMVRFGADVTSPTLTTTASKTDIIGVVYNAAASKYDVVAVAKGY